MCSTHAITTGVCSTLKATRSIQARFPPSYIRSILYISAPFPRDIYALAKSIRHITIHHRTMCLLLHRPLSPRRPRRSVPATALAKRILMQHYRSCLEVQASEMLVTRDNVHEVSELDPEGMRQSEKFGFRFFVKMEDFLRCQKSGWISLRHASAELAPE